MEFKEYQTLSRKTAVYPDQGHNFIYPVLGLVGEAGEVANKVKKILRDDGGEVKAEKIEDIKKEMGDVLWYMAQVATEFGLELDDIAQDNLDKLLSRQNRGVIGGAGDNR